MIYFDSSALIKLVIVEAESDALVRFVAKHAATLQVSSELAITELRRGLHRAGAPEAATNKATEILDGLTLLPVSRQVLEYAAAIPGRHLRSLDAIHLASAIRLRSGLSLLVTYDKRLAEAAREANLPVSTPS